MKTKILVYNKSVKLLGFYLKTMQKETERKEFILRLITKYFFYGYLCLLGIVILLVFSYFFYKKFNSQLKLVSIIFLLCSIPLLGQFFRIVFSTNHKFRYFKISKYRLRTRGYKDSYFECEMHEPCFRLIIKDLLKTYGFQKEYYELREKCRGKNLRVERAKEKLLAKVMKEYADKSN